MVWGPHFEYHCLMTILESRCHHSSGLQMRKLRHSAVTEHAQGHPIAESKLRLRDPSRTLCHPACVHSLGSLYPIPARMDGQADEKSGHHSWALPSGLTTASQDVLSLYRQGKGVQTKAQGSEWLTQDHPATQDWGPAASLDTLSPAVSPPHTVNRNCIPMYIHPHTAILVSFLKPDPSGRSRFLCFRQGPTQEPMVCFLLPWLRN